MARMTSQEAETKLAELEAERTRHEETIREMSEDEEKAVRGALLAGQSPYADVSSSASRAKGKREKAEKRIQPGGTLEAELREMRAVVEQLRNEEAVERLREYQARAEPLDDRERDVWSKLGEQFQALLETFAEEYVPILEERIALNREVVHEANVPFTDETREAWDEAIRPHVEPFAGDTAAMLSLLIDAVLDPRDVYRSRLHGIDRKGRLLDLVPDARHLLRRIEAGSHFDKRSSSNGYMGMPTETVGFAGLA
jgi:hypothetical protein